MVFGTVFDKSDGWRNDRVVAWITASYPATSRSQTLCRSEDADA